MHAERVAWVTGEHSANETGPRWAVGGTDLGICWDDGQDGVLVAFGDTFTPRAPSGGAGEDWHSNVIARSHGRDLSGRMTLDWFATDRPGHAREGLPARKIDHIEVTTIPTGGVCAGSRQYLAYMSDRKWGRPGRWRTNYGGIAFSDDSGTTWVKPTGHGSPTWPNTWRGTQRFQMTPWSATSVTCCCSGPRTAGPGRATWPEPPRATCWICPATSTGTGSDGAQGIPAQAGGAPLRCCQLRSPS